MENLNNILQTRVNFSIPADLMKNYKEIASRENLSLSKAITQFMLNYTDYLDNSFFKTKDLLKGKKDTFLFFTSEEIAERFKEKTEREKVRPSMVIAQFMKNYIDFTNMNEES